MRDFILLWFRPEGVIAIGMVVNIFQLWRARRAQTRVAADVRELAVNTNSIQTALNAAKVAEGRVLEREDARARDDAGKPT
jgi:hypothetical protein